MRKTKEPKQRMINKDFWTCQKCLKSNSVVFKYCQYCETPPKDTAGEDLMISHGMTTHSHNERRTCKECMEALIEFQEATGEEKVCPKCFAVGGHQMACPEVCIDPRGTQPPQSWEKDGYDMLRTVHAEITRLIYVKEPMLKTEYSRCVAAIVTKHKEIVHQLLQAEREGFIKNHPKHCFGCENSNVPCEGLLHKEILFKRSKREHEDIIKKIATLKKPLKLVKKESKLKPDRAVLVFTAYNQAIEDVISSLKKGRSEG